jgi:hypothetical protein
MPVTAMMPPCANGVSFQKTRSLSLATKAVSLATGGVNTRQHALAGA